MQPLWLLLFSTVLFLPSGAAFGAHCMKGFIINKQDCCHLYLGFKKNTQKNPTLFTSRCPEQINQNIQDI